MLGVFLCFNAPRFDQNFDKKTLRSRKSPRIWKSRMPQLHITRQHSSEVAKSYRNDFGAEKTAHQ